MVDEISLFHGAVWYAVLLFSTTLHEASHAFAALKLGDDTAHRGGQVSLDPIPHIKREPIGMVVAPLVSFAISGWMVGWASAPYDPYWANRFPRKAATMAMAGPASNLLLVIFSAIFIHIGMVAGLLQPPEVVNFTSIVEATRSGWPEMIATVLSIMFSLNLVLCFFNLLPFPPLDGSCIPAFFLSDEAAAKYSDALNNPMFSIFGLMIGWKIFAIIFPPLHLFAVNLLYPGLTYG